MCKSDNTDLGHALSSLWMGAPGWVLVNLLAGDGGDQLKEFWGNSIRHIVVVVIGGRGCVWQMNLANGGDESDDLNSKDLLKIPLSNCACGDTA